MCSRIVFRGRLRLLLPRTLSEIGVFVADCLYRLVFRAIGTDKEILDAEIKPCSITRLGFGFKSFVVCCDSDIPITERITFDRNAVDITLYLARIPEPIPASVVGFSQPARSFTFAFSIKSHRAVFRHDLNLGGRFALPSKKLYPRSNRSNIPAMPKNTRQHTLPKVSSSDSSVKRCTRVVSQMR